MKLSSASLLLCLGFVRHGADAVSLRRRQDGSPRVLSLDVQRSIVHNATPSGRLRRRSGVVNTTVDNMEVLYFVNISLGNPPQDVRVHLDTGSSDLWVNTPRSAFCSTPEQRCRPSGTYEPRNSRSHAVVNRDFNISYVDGSGAAGDYVTDTLRINGNEVKDFQFGVGYSSSSAQAVLGIGYKSNEALVARTNSGEYVNLPARMADENIINSNAYSLWLNDVNADAGTVLFGGVDAERYHGQLVKLPIQDGHEFFITLTSVETRGKKLSQDGMALAVLLDSGSSLTYLPPRLADRILREVNATFTPQDGIAFVPCSLRDRQANLTFRFSDPATIDVPMREMVIDPVRLTGKRRTFSDGKAACYFGIKPTDSETATSVLGDTFLRSAYVVYDLENHEISLAQTKFNATLTSVKTIGEGRDAVPDAITAGNPVTAQSGLPRRRGKGRVKETTNQGSGAGMVAPSWAAVMLAGTLGTLVGFLGFVA